MTQPIFSFGARTLDKLVVGVSLIKLVLFELPTSYCPSLAIIILILNLSKGEALFWVVHTSSFLHPNQFISSQRASHHGSFLPAGANVG